MSERVVGFTKEAVLEYLDAAIKLARKQRDGGDCKAMFYVDAFQSVRISLFGELLPQEEIESGNGN